MPVTLSRIIIYPVKSLDGISVDQTSFTLQGGLLNDRRWALFDAAGAVVNGKRTPLVHQLRAEFDLASSGMTLSVKGTSETRTFALDRDRQAIEDWCSDFFGRRVFLRENANGGFPDDPDAPGPTLISTASLKLVAEWFSGLSAETVRQRFRANLELECSEPFWEDRLYARAGEVLRFRVGEMLLEGTNPCQRCAVPPRSPETGEVWPGFAREFADRRQATFPGWAEASRFDHFYRLAVNTRVIPGSMGRVAVGDEVTLLGVEPRF